MKQLLVIRHAKSSWEIGSLNDFDRPLNDRGNRDAPLMAMRLENKNIKIDAFVSSPANRAKTTAVLFSGILQKNKDSIIYLPQLYNAGSATFYEVIQSLKEEWQTVAIFSHNPGITAFVNSLTNTKIDEMPTCGVFAVTCNIDSWESFSNNEKTFLFFDYPKLG